MKKRILCFAMTLILALGASTAVYARDYQGKDGWTVDFDGDKMNSNFTSADLADETQNIQPGDSIELKVQIKNSGATDTDWYMTNEVVQTLEDAKSSASGGAYGYRLTYIDGNGTVTTLYDSSTVGGEGTGQSSEGLNQATNALQDYFYIDRLSRNESGSVHLWVQVEGETQGNGYQQTLAKLQMNFAAEKVTAAGQNIKKVNNVTKPSSTASTTVKTGDNSKILLFSVIALVSGVILLGLGFYTMKKRKNSEKGE